MALPVGRVSAWAFMHEFIQPNLGRPSLSHKAPVGAHVALGAHLPGFVEGREVEDLDAVLARPSVQVSTKYCMAPSRDGTEPWKALPWSGQPVSLISTRLPGAAARVRATMVCM
jgi:hypothetical protein